MATIKSLAGKRITRKTKFMNEEIEIQKLTIQEVRDMQEAVEASKADAENGGYMVLQKIVRMGVVGGDDLSDDDFNGFPMDELSKVSDEIMKFSGFDGKKEGK